jgi:rhodanese-related sulfurtransferase
MFERKELKKIIRESLLLIVITTLIAFTVNLFHPRGYIFVSRDKMKLNKIVYISSSEAKIKFDHNSAIFIDSRNPDAYRVKHIKGSINIPAFPESTLVHKIRESFSLLKQAKEIVIYCTGVSCSTDETVAKRLLEFGYRRHLYILKRGLPEWEGEGYPIER